MKRSSILAAALAATALLGSADAIEPAELAKRQCRSIHLGYPAPASEWAVIDVVAEKSAPGTYFCAMGFNRGYFGMQELASGKKVVIFSVWDKHDPNNKTDRQQDTAEANRVGVIEVGDGVRKGRFSGEGTGSQSFYDYDWKIGEPVRFAVHAKPEGEFTTYTGQFYDASRKQWQLMASFRTHSGAPLAGLYSFVEDFRRNYESAKIARRARFVNGWAMNTEGAWHPLIQARFTADPTPSNAIDAAPVEDGFFLQTGGDTKNEKTKLRDMMKRPKPAADKPALSGLKL